MPSFSDPQLQIFDNFSKVGREWGEMRIFQKNKKGLQYINCMQTLDFIGAWRGSRTLTVASTEGF